MSGMRPKIQMELAFPAEILGEAQGAAGEGPNHLRRTWIPNAPLASCACSQGQHANVSHRTAVYVTRMHGGVGGGEPQGSPLSRSASGHEDFAPATPRFLFTPDLRRNRPGHPSHQKNESTPLFSLALRSSRTRPHRRNPCHRPPGGPDNSEVVRATRRGCAPQTDRHLNLYWNSGFSLRIARHYLAGLISLMLASSPS